MFTSTSSRSFCHLVLSFIALFITACMPAIPQAPAALQTPTPEIFMRLNPSPTPPDSTLPLTCQVTDLNVYVNKDWGYCFAYPTEFTIDESQAAKGIVYLYGPALDNNTDPLRVSLEIITQVMPKNSELAPLVDAFLVPFQNTPWEITREALKLGGEDAERLEPIPGLLSSRILIALHNDILFTFRFQPQDFSPAKFGLNTLTQTVSGSFAFLDSPAELASQLETFNWSEFGETISLSYDSILAPWVDARTVPAVPVSDQTLFAESHPAYAQIRFLGFEGGRLYELPLLPFDNRVAQVMIFQTADFPGFGDDNPQGFVNQSAALKGLLRRRGELSRCGKPITGEPALPFLPWVNAKQSFCAQPQVIEFGNGRGIRYLSHYAQDPSPVLDQNVFYTFQGITDDGRFYISAVFPVQTGIFPTEPPACPQCSEANYDPIPEWTAILATQLNELNTLPVDDFLPSIHLLDELIRSIRIEN